MTLKDVYKATMYKQGSSWYVSYYSTVLHGWCLSAPLSYQQARHMCGVENHRK